jgi:hypothetical protein
MRTLPCLIVLAASATLAPAAEETAVTPQLESIGLFKNGLAVVRASFPVSGPGRYRWDKVPRVVHGSFWMESDGIVSVLSTTRMIEETPETESPTGRLQRDLAGRQVTVVPKNRMGNPITPISAMTAEQPIKGTVWEIPTAPAARVWDTHYSSLNPGNRYWDPRGATSTPAPLPDTGNFLVLLDQAGNRRYIDQSSIEALIVDGPFGPVKRKVERPVLVFDVREAPAGGGAVRVTYLTKGLAWLPAYQVDISDPAKLEIRQSAVVRNEMDDLSDSELHLISGYPNVRFGSVDSPLWPGTGLAAFFQQVNQSGQQTGGLLSNNIMSQQMVYSNSAARVESTPLPDVGESGNASDDIHYENIGRHNLKAGDSLSLDIASAQAAYERVVDWTVPDPRDARGRYQRVGENRSEDDEPWDALRFANPFKFPMTTASAVVMEDGRFRGQSLSQWVNPGQTTCLRITRALSVRAESGEVEEEGQREIVWIGGNDYQRTRVKGRLTLHNYRGKEVTMNIRCEFSGKMLEADGNPKAKLRTEGVSSINPRRELQWDVKIPAGGEKELTYRYEVLVDR